MGKLQSAIQRWVRRLLDLPSPDEIQQVIEFLFEKPTRDLEDLKADAELKIDELHSVRLHVQAELSALRVKEQDIKARFAELARAEEDMKRVAYGVSVTIYDLVQAVQIEHGAVGLTPEGKAILSFDNDEPRQEGETE